MDFKALALDAWSITRRTHATWWLGLVSVAQAGVYAVIVGSITGPLAAMPQLLPSSSLSFDAQGSQLASVRDAARVAVTAWVTRYGTDLIVGIVVVFVVWIAIGVLDVASQAGLITQAVAAVDGRRTSFRAGMRSGFRVWGRTVGLLAIGALPGLFAMLLIGLISFLTMTLPLLLGAQPNPGAAVVGNVLASPLSALAALAGIPLGMAVQLGLRDAVLADAHWRTAFVAGWKTLKAHPAQVSVAYLLIAAVGVAVTLLAGVVLAVIVVPSAAIAFAVGGGSGPTAIASGMFVLVPVSAMILLPMTVLNYVWGSCLWTLLWRRLTNASGAVLQ